MFSVCCPYSSILISTLVGVGDTATTALLCSTTYLLGLLAPPSIFQLLNPRPAPPPLAAESEEGKKYTEKIENELLNLKMLKECRERDGKCLLSVLSRS